MPRSREPGLRAERDAARQGRDAAREKPAVRRGARTVAAPAPPPAPPHDAQGVVVGREVPVDGALARPLSLPGVSLEAALYTLLLGFSLLIRLWRVDDAPLGTPELRTALASLDIMRGGRLPSDAGALLGFGDALVFAVLGATDATARLLPALIGGLVPLAMLPARPLIGRGPAVIAAILLTFSPILLDQARSVSSGAIAATLSLALVFVVFDYARARSPRRLYQGATLLALTLTAGASAVPALLSLATLGVSELLAFARRSRLPEQVDDAIALIAPPNGHVDEVPPANEAPVSHATPREQVLRALALFGVVLGVAATGALTNPNGLDQGMFAPVAAWLDALLPGGATAPFWLGPLIWVVYEPLACVLGLVGAIYALRRGRALDRVLGLWMVLGLLAAFLAPERSAMLLAGAVPPATVLAAIVCNRLLLGARRAGWIATLWTVAGVTWGVFLLLYGIGHATLVDPIAVRYLAPYVGSAETATMLLIALPAALLIAVLVYLWVRLGSERRGALGFAGALLLLGFTVHAGWNLAYQSTENVAELPRLHQTSLDVRAMHDDLDELIQVLTINKKDRTVVVDEAFRLPLSWYLSDMSPRFESGQPTTSPPVYVAPADAKSPGNRYAGQRYRVALSMDPIFPNAAAFWRWLLYREPPSAVRVDDAMAFVRAQ